MFAIHYLIHYDIKQIHLNKGNMYNKFEARAFQVTFNL